MKAATNDNCDDKNKANNYDGSIDEEEQLEKDGGGSLCQRVVWLPTTAEEPHKKCTDLPTCNLKKLNAADLKYVLMI